MWNIEIRLWEIFLTNLNAADKNAAVLIAAIMFTQIRVQLEEC